MGEEKRHEMMQNLFGDDQSEEEEEIDSEHESNPQPNYISVISPFFKFLCNHVNIC